ncbi:MAG: metal ABC transporter substrate-binding protein [Clostridia bacterium]
MKKILLLTVCLLSACMMFSACSTTSTTDTDTSVSEEETDEETDETEESEEKLSLVVTSFYQYDWLLQVLGDEAENFDITLLVDDGTDLHNYEPTVADMLTITTSDMFIYTGGESDDWVADVIAQGDNDDLNAVSMMTSLGDDVLAEIGTSNVDGEVCTDDCCTDEDHDDEEAETEEEHDHDEDEAETEEEHDHEEGEDDEHVWLSLKNAMTLTQSIANEMATLDPDNADTYQVNATAYIESLSELDVAYEELISSDDIRDTVIFADRFPFTYLVTDYDLSYYAAFDGCSSETEASFETIAWLTDAANEYDVSYLLIIETGTTDIADTIISGMDNQDVEVLILDSMQNVSEEMINSGTTYYSVMTSNLEVLTLALAK